MQQRRPVMLVVLDGWGWRDDPADNAVRQAHTPNFDRLWASRPASLLRTSGRDVGLPDGQMGNSEVGHLNIGAGRVVMQDLPRINQAIATARSSAAGAARPDRKPESERRHLPPDGPGLARRRAFASGPRRGAGRILAGAGVPTAVHAFTDGRDTPPRSAATTSRASSGALPSAAIATVSGRYYAMDRDKRWERVEQAYARDRRGGGTALSRRARRSRTPTRTASATSSSSRRSVGDYRGMRDGDGVLCFNFRADRVREILAALLDPAFAGFPRPRTVRFAAPSA